MTVLTDNPASAASDGALPENEARYPENIWEYLEGDYHLALRYMPTRDDRDGLDDRRQRIWDYFFRIDPADVGRPHQKKIAQLRSRRDSEIQHHEQRIRELNGRKAILDNERDLLQQIRDVEVALQQSKQRSIESPKSTDRLSGFLKRAAPGAEVIGQTQEQEQHALEDQLRRLQDKLASLQQRSQNPSSVGGEPLRPRPERTLAVVEQQAAAIPMEISELQRKHSDHMKALDDLTQNLERAIEKLKRQLPEPPSDDTVRQWLQEDLDRLEQQAQVRVAAGTRLQAIASYDETTSTERVTDLIRIVSPGRIQDATRLPLSYLPPQIGAARELFDQVVAGIDIKGNQLAQWIRPKTVPDRGKHLLAKRLLQTDQGLVILYGVYYVDLLMILDDMMILHSFFFDFVSGKTTAERTTEVYYEDIVALETSQEYRAIPLQYTDDPNAALILEDVPVLSLILSNGERHTVSFVNEAYLRGLLKHIEAEVSSPLRLDRNHVDLYVERSVLETAQTADDAIKVLRAQVRQHKATRRPGLEA
jgi:hypothetical protein